MLHAASGTRGDPHRVSAPYEGRDGHARPGPAGPPDRHAGRRPHEVLGTPLKGPFPDGFQVAVFGMGCFWGAERLFWTLPGVYTTSAGYAGGITTNPTYEETCSGRTGHAEVVQVVYDPQQDQLRGPAEGLLGEPRPDPGHAPGQRRGHPVPLGDLHHHRRRSGPSRESSRDAFPPIVTRAGKGEITTEIAPLGELLLRRGLPPAVPCADQEPERVLQPRPERDELPGGRGQDGLTPAQRWSHRGSAPAPFGVIGALQDRGKLTLVRISQANADDVAELARLLWLDTLQ